MCMCVCTARAKICASVGLFVSRSILCTRLGSGLRERDEWPGMGLSIALDYLYVFFLLIKRQNITVVIWQVTLMRHSGLIKYK